MEEPTVLDIMKLLNILPQRYPFVLIDRIVKLVPGKEAVAIKNVSYNEAFFEGHFPGNPVMPGTLIIEAMAQAAIVLYASAYEDELTKKPEYYLGSVKTQFKQPVRPGDQLRLTVEAVRMLPTGAFISATASVKDTQIAQAELVFAVKR